MVIIVIGDANEERECAGERGRRRGAQASAASGM